MKDFIYAFFNIQNDFEYGVFCGIIGLILIAGFFALFITLFFYFDDLNDLRKIDINKLPKKYLKDENND